MSTADQMADVADNLDSFADALRTTAAAVHAATDPTLATAATDDARLLRDALPGLIADIGRRATEDRALLAVWQEAEHTARAAVTALEAAADQHRRRLGGRGPVGDEIAPLAAAVRRRADDAGGVVHALLTEAEACEAVAADLRPLSVRMVGDAAALPIGRDQIRAGAETLTKLAGQLEAHGRDLRARVGRVAS